ncbi:hypothetical protein [Verrucomicrobium sp. BvORR106]|uniref:hypothetical protein n=1 Tax=Verrucomicrobium sp. BvORR106 TaxID=1403819 RepID=UPI00056E6183|nr:hypothetical protein [Verrucomicrobium sp. BvORR106]
MKNLKPMEAVAVLYATGQEDVSRAIVASLSQTIFGGTGLEPANRAKQLLARISYRLLKWTTRSVLPDGASHGDATVYRNVILDRSGHPYAAALMGTTSKATQCLVEGGDPMNSQYMMISPEIRQNAGTWDRIFLDSVQGKDVRLRMVWETLATYEAARALLDGGKSVRMKAVAAGTGLSLILVYDRLIRDGFDPSRITVSITDRDPVNIEKANRLMDKIETTKGRTAVQERSGGILARPEDLFARLGHGDTGLEPYDVVTAIGILEYFHGHTYTTTEHHLNLSVQAEAASAIDLVQRLDEMVSDQGSVVVNTYRRNAATQLLELFGRRFDYRDHENLTALMAAANFELTRLMGSGHVYDVEVYGKKSVTMAA